MKRTCLELQKLTSRESFREALGRSAVSQPTQDFAEAFPAMQEARHLADYDPGVQFQVSDVVGLIDAAEAAMDSFDQVLPPERADILAFLLVGTRT